MPPESLPPWDRKDFFRDRKRERSVDPVGHVPRWRDSPHHGTSSPRDYNRWSASGYRGRTPGHGKQGGWHQYPEQPGHGFSPYLSSERMDSPYRPYRPTERIPASPFRPTERIDSPYRPSERFGTPYRSTERIAPPYRPAERIGTPYRSAERMPSPYRPSERIGTPYRPSERTGTPYGPSERIGTPYRSIDRVATPRRSVDGVASPFRSIDRVATPRRSVDVVASPFRSEWIASPFRSSERGAPPYRSERGSTTPFRPERGSTTPFRSSEKVASPYRSSEKIVDGETWRSSETRVDGKCNGNSWESRPLFSLKDSEGHRLENGGSTDGSSKLLNVNAQRSVDDIPTGNPLPHSDAINATDQIHLKDQHDKIGSDNSLPHSDSINARDQLHLKDQHDKIDSDNSLPRSDTVNASDQVHLKDQHDKIDSVGASGTGLRLERGGSLGSIDWKPHRWTRSGSLSARSSGFTHLSGSKRFGTDFSEAKADAQDKIVNQVESQSVDAAGCAQSAAQSEETISRKKPRVRWGEGLAKYEKKKVDVPEVVGCSSIEASSSDLPNLADKSLRLASFPGFASPTTPSSVGYSSSPGMEEKRFLDTSTTDNATSKNSGSPGLHLGDIVGAREFDLESLDAASVANLSSSLSELLQFNGPTSEDSSFVRATAMNKLIVWKGSVTKALEMAESEIDSLENELKSLVTDSRTSGPCPAESSSLPANSEVKTCEDQVAGSDSISQLAGLQFVSSVNQIVVDQEHDMEEVPDQGADSPGTVTSKLIEPLSSLKDDKLVDQIKYRERSVDLGAITPTNLEPEVPIHSSECPIGKNLHDYEGAKLYDLIIASNKECADRASDLFRKLLPSDQCDVGMSKTSSVSNWSNDTFIKEKFVARKQFLKFKERVYTFKFMALRRLWREDMRLLSVRKNRAKSQKRSESSFQTLRGSNQKHRSSVRSRFSPGKNGNLRVVPSAEVINFTSKLLSGSQFKRRRNALRMPAMVLDNKEKIALRFVSNNGLVQDPCAVEKERALINPWTTEEKEIFMDKLVTFGKDFGKIASFLDHKTTADCVEFYYKNHKSDCFPKTKKKPKLAGQVESCSTHNYLVTSEKRWNREADAASLDMLGAVSAVAAKAGDGMKRPKNCASSSLLRVANNHRAPQLDDDSVERLDNFDALDSDRETVAVGVLAGICGSLSSEAMSSCITSSFDPAESQQDSKSQKVMSSMRRPLTPEVGQSIDDDSCSDDSCDEMDGADWSEEEKVALIQAFTAYGKDFDMMSKCVRTRSKDQCRIFFSKGRKILGLDTIVPRSGNNKAPVTDGADCGGTDSEDACDLPNGSVICSEKSESKLDDGLVSADKMDVEMNNSSEVDEDAISQSNAEEFMKMVPEVDKEVGVNLKTSDSNPADNRTGEVELKDSEVEQEHLVADVLMGECTTELISVGKCKMGSDGNIEEDGGTGSGFALEPPAACEMAIDHSLSVPGADGETAANKLPPENSSAREDTYINANICDVAQQVDCSEQDMDTSSNASDVAIVAEPLVAYPEKEHQTTLELHPSGSVDVSLANGNRISDAPPSHCETMLEQGTHSAIGFGKSGYEKQSINSADADDRNKNQSKLAVSPSAESLQVPAAQVIPVAVTTRKETSGTHSGLNLLQGCFLQKCNSLEAQNPAIELPLMSLDKRPNHGNTALDVGKPKSGDVKIFGQILSSASTVQNDRNGGARESDDRGKQPAGWGTDGLNMRSRARSADANSVAPDGQRLGIESAPLRSYGFWDGNRIQTGVSSLPDSSLLLAKYPAAFAYPTSFNQQQQVQSVNGQYFSGGTAADHPMYRRNWENAGTRVPPYNFDMMQQRQNVLFPEMQRRNGVEGFQGIQQGESGAGPARTNFTPRRGIFSGEIITGAVSDPVAAIKLHYAKATLDRLEAKARSAGEARRT